jgi:hypothetical protein
MTGALYPDSRGVASNVVLTAGGPAAQAGTVSSTPAADRLFEALEMWEDGVQIMRENLRRRFPNALPEAIEAYLAEWLEGPTSCDEDRALVPWPRPRK